MGQARIRSTEIREIKALPTERLLHKDETFEIFEILKLQKKKGYMSKYKNAYTGMMKSISDPQLYGENVRFISAKLNGIEAGFIRINNKSAHFPDSAGIAIWNITDGFTEKEFRGNGILLKLIKFAIKNLKVKMFYIEKQRYLLNMDYYRHLGFTRYVPSTDGVMIWGFLEDMKPLVPHSFSAHKECSFMNQHSQV